MKSRRTILFLTLILLASIVSPLNGEVERITVSWNSAICNAHCAELIEKNFMNLQELDQVNVDPGRGVANLRWNPETPFSYAPIRTSMAMVGAKINDIRVRVRGVVREEGKDVALYSLGDNTRFLLVSPIRPQPHRQTVLPHPSLRELDPGLRDRILVDAEQDKIMVIEGPLYKPSRSPPLMIVIERIQVEKKQAPRAGRK